MAIMPGPLDLQQRIGSLEELLRKIESAADPSLRATVQELVELVMSLHGAGLQRMLELTRAAGEPGEAVIQKLGRDELVAGLLVLHGLHPLTMEERAAHALDKVRSRLRPHGADVELLSVEDGSIRLRLHVKSQGCGSTAQSLKEMVEEAVYQAAPDLTALTIEGDEQRQSFVPLEMLRTVQPAGQTGNAGL
jgi:Fe-S cluster biogenesis protein NfuA